MFNRIYSTYVVWLWVYVYNMLIRFSSTVAIHCLKSAKGVYTRIYSDSEMNKLFTKETRINVYRSYFFNAKNKLHLKIEGKYEEGEEKIDCFHLTDLHLIIPFWKSFLLFFFSISILLFALFPKQRMHIILSRKREKRVRLVICW